MEDKDNQNDIKQVLIDSIDALRNKRKALLARKYIISCSKPEEFVPKRSLFGNPVTPIDQNISYAAIKKDLLVADIEIEISGVDDQLLARREHLKIVNKKIQELENAEKENNEN